MSKKEKTLEEALLQIKNIEDAMKQNAKGILESTMKQELKDLLNEEESDMAEGEGTEDMSVNAIKGLSNPKEVSEEEDVAEGEGVDNMDANAIKGTSNPKEVAEGEGVDNMDANAIKGTSNPKEVAEGEGVDNMDANAIKGTSNPKEVSEEDVDEQDSAVNEQLGDEENDDDLDNDEPEMDSDEPMGDEGGEDFGDEMGDTEEPELDDEEDVFDMTNASDDEVLKVFKAMGPEDGIVVKKDGNKVEVNTGDEEFIIKLDSEGEEEPEAPVAEPEPEMDDEFGDEEGGEDFGGEDFGDEMDDEEEGPLAEEDGVLEVTLDEDCDGELEECGEVEEGDVDEQEEDVDEAARTKWNPHGDKGPNKRAGLKNKKMFKAGSKSVNENYETLKKQYNVLKEQNAEYKKALGLFREKINEVAVFNANLAYATRLFTEHSTTKKEKMEILERFDSITSMNESKKTYATIKKELDSKTTVTENVAEKISKTPSSSSSKEMLEESKAYENPQFKRMKDLMNKIK